VAWLGVAAALGAAGCGRPAPAVGKAAPRQPSASAGPATPAPPGPPAGQAAAGLANVLPLLGGAGLPVYLPSWLPAPPAGEAFDLAGEAGASGYSVAIAEGAEPAVVSGLPAAPLIGQIASIAGGAPGTLGAVPAFAPPPEAPRPVALAPGVLAAYYAQTPSGTFSLLRWQVGDWSFAVADTTGLGASATALAAYGRELAAALPADGEPVPGIVTGTVVQTLEPDGAPVFITWRAGAWEYELQAQNAPPLRLSASLVRVGPA